MRSIFFIFFMLEISCAQVCELENKTALYRAKKISEKFSGKSSNYSYSRSTPKKINDLASNWIKESFCFNQNKEFYKELKIDAIYRENSSFVGDKSLVQICDVRIDENELKNDFTLALKAYKTYPGIFYMVEISKKDWDKLPQENQIQNLSLKEVNFLRKNGYIPVDVCPIYNNWAITEEIVGFDGIERRWIYPYFSKIDSPALNFYDPSFGANQIISSKILQAIENNCKILKINSDKSSDQSCYLLDVHTTNTLGMQIRKLGGFSYKWLDGNFKKVSKYLQSGADAIYHPLLTLGLLHSLFKKDTSFLKIIYQQMLTNHLQPIQFIHKSPEKIPFTLEHFSKMDEPIFYKNKLYHPLDLKDEIEDDLNFFKKNNPDELVSTPLGYCMQTLGKKAHFLMSFYLAMQPGIFFFTTDDLTGRVNGKNLYPSIKEQLEDKDSYLSYLKTLLKVRKVYHIDTATLIDIPKTIHKELFILLHKLPLENGLQVSIMNFSNKRIEEEIEIDQLFETYGMDLVQRQSFSKAYKSKKLFLKLDPLECKCLAFYKKAYNNSCK